LNSLGSRFVCVAEWEKAASADCCPEIPTRGASTPRIPPWHSAEGAEVLAVAQEEAAEAAAGEEAAHEGEGGAVVVVDMAVRG
jgi:hypothetical protein